MTVQVRRSGILATPADIRKRYDIDDGDASTLVDLSARSFLIDQVAPLMEEGAVALDEVLEALDEELEAYYRQH